MVVKVFRDEKSKFEHEYDQFEEVYNLINNNYAKIDEFIYILTNLRLLKTEIDVLVLTEKGMAIIDLKSYEGKVIGDETGDWKVIIENGKEARLEKNLFRQLLNLYR